MPKHAKPRWDFRQEHNVQEESRRFGRVDIDRVEALLGCLNPDADLTLERSLIALLGDFYTEKFEDPGPNWNEVQAALDETLKAASRLEFCLHHLDIRARSWIETSLEQNRGQRHACADCQTMAAALAELTQAIATVELPTEPRRRGRRPDTAMKHLVLGLSDLYYQHTGSPALNGFHRNAIDDRYEGPLVVLMEYLLEAFAPDLGVTNAAIGEQIRSTIGDRS